MSAILVVGAGVFGLSTALAASKSRQVSQVTLVDDGYHDAASRGLGRIFRSQYPREEYEELAQTAKPLWVATYSAFFHEKTKSITYPNGSHEEDPNAAWIEARKVMDDALREAKEMGIVFVEDTIDRLTWSGRRCTGAVTCKGFQVQADKTLLALGAGLPGFLASEGRRVNDTTRFSIDDFYTPIAFPWIRIQLDEDTFQLLKSRPITVYPGKGMLQLKP
jgi:glycine/D-amino acid oxidase-like deaminating enzyme